MSKVKTIMTENKEKVEELRDTQRKVAQAFADHLTNFQGLIDATGKLAEIVARIEERLDKVEKLLNSFNSQRN